MHGICEKLLKLKIGKEKPKLVHGFVVRIFFFFKIIIVATVPINFLTFFILFYFYM